MRAARLFPVSPSMHCTGGAWSSGVPGPGGVSSLGGVLSWGVCSGGGYPSMQWGRPSPWTEFLTHATENITLAQFRCGR